MLVDHWVSWTSDIHKFKCYIVVIQEFGHISQVNTSGRDTNDFYQLPVYVYMYSRVVKQDIQMETFLANAVLILVSRVMSSNLKIRRIYSCVVFGYANLHL